MEKEIKTISEKVVEAVEKMKDEGMKNAQKPNKSNKVGKSNADELQKDIERKTEELQKCLAELERKKQLSNNRTAFIHALDKLKEASDKLEAETDFESVLYKLKFGDATSYGNSDIFSISNRLILSEFVGFIREKINIKIVDIEMQLITE